MSTRERDLHGARWRVTWLALIVLLATTMIWWTCSVGSVYGDPLSGMAIVVVMKHPDRGRETVLCDLIRVDLQASGCKIHPVVGSMHEDTDASTLRMLGIGSDRLPIAMIVLTHKGRPTRVEDSVSATGRPEDVARSIVDSYLRCVGLRPAAQPSASTSTTSNSQDTSSNVSSGPFTLEKWATSTTLKATHTQNGRANYYTVPFDTTNAKLHQGPFHVIVSYNNDRNIWVIVYTNVVNMHRSYQFPLSLDEWCLHYNADHAGARFCLEHSATNDEIQVESDVPTSLATVPLVDQMVKDVASTADTNHDQCVNLINGAAQ